MKRRAVIGLIIKSTKIGTTTQELKGIVFNVRTNVTKMKIAVGWNVVKDIVHGGEKENALERWNSSLSTTLVERVSKNILKIRFIIE